MDNKFIPVALVAILVIAIGAYMFPQSVQKLVQVGASGPRYFDALEFQGGVTYGRVNSTSTTATTQTLNNVDIVGSEGAAFDTVIFTPNTGATSLTFPATSTLPHFISQAGFKAEQCWHNATTTVSASGNITFVAGSGMNLMGTSTNLTLGGTQTACFTFIREGDKDMTVIFEKFQHAD